MSTATAARRECGPVRPRARGGGGGGDVALALVSEPRGLGNTSWGVTSVWSKGPVGGNPPLGVRSLVAETPREGLHQRQGLYSVACGLSEGSELVLVPAEGRGRSWREGSLGYIVCRVLVLEGRVQGQGVLPLFQPTTEFGPLHTVGAN